MGHPTFSLIGCSAQNVVGAGNCTNSLASGATCTPACNPGYALSGTTSSCTTGNLTAATCSPNVRRAQLQLWPVHTMSYILLQRIPPLTNQPVASLSRAMPVPPRPTEGHNILDPLIWNILSTHLVRQCCSLKCIMLSWPVKHTKDCCLRSLYNNRDGCLDNRKQL